MSETKSEPVFGKEAHAASDSISSAEEPEVRISIKTWLVLFAIGLSYAAQLLNLVGSGAQGHTIAAHFGALDKASWFSETIIIFIVIMAPIGAQASDYWGRKWILVVSSFIAVIGCIIVSRAQNIGTAIAGFAVNGLSNGSQALFHIVASEILPRKWRALAQGLDMVAVSAGSIIALIVGGALNRTSDPASNGFRTYFYINAAMFAAAGLITWWAYNPPETPKQREFRGQHMQKLAKLDWGGYVLIAIGLVLFCLALTWSKNPFPWSDAHVSATFAVGVFFSLLLVVYEWKFKKDGMFHHGLFTTRNFPIALFCIFTEGMSFMAGNVYFSYEVGFLFEPDGVLNAAHYSIVWITALVVSPLTGLYCAKTKEIKWATVFGFVVFTTFFAGMATIDGNSSNLVWGLPVLLGVAIGMSINLVITNAQLSTPRDLLSLTSGTILSMRCVGGTVGVAIFEALFSNELSKLGVNIGKAVIPAGLSKENLGAFIEALTEQNQEALAAVPGITTEIIEAGSGALVDTYLIAFRNVWIAAAAFVAAAGVAACFMYSPTEEFNMHVDAPIEKVQVETRERV